MYIIGITGPSGAGKTTALRVLEAMGGRVFDCDAVYHEMLATDGELLGRIEAAFPGAVKDYALDRKALGAKVFADPAGLEKLTAITQPLVAERVMEEIRRSEHPSSVTSVRTGDTFPPGGRLCAAAATGRQIAGATGVVAAGGRPMAAPTGGAIRFCHSEQREESVPPSPDTPLEQATGRQIAGATGFAVIDAIGLFESGLGAKCDLTVAVVADPEVRVRRLTARDGITEDYARARIAAQKPVEFYTAQAALVLENNGTEAEFAETCRKAFLERLRGLPGAAAAHTTKIAKNENI